MTNATLHLGQTLRFEANPFHAGVEAAQHETQGAVLVEDGLFKAVGRADDLRKAHPETRLVDHGQHLLLPGFIDAHAHYAQTGIIASWGKRLIDWLNSYTFPEEMRFGDRVYADTIAGQYMDFLLAQGTTSVCTFCTIHPASVDALFNAATARNMRVFAGKTCMDRNAPDGLRDTAQSAYDDSRALLQNWHGTGRNSYVITPRFSPTSTPEQLEALGALWAEHPECLMQTHLSEQLDEIDWVKSLFPQARDYLDTYEQFGLLNERGLYGHAIHLEEREKSRLREVNASLIHCPTSNTFIGSGLFDMNGLTADGHLVGLATDTGGGSSFSMLRSMAAAYEIGQLKGRPLHPSELLWLATAGSAQALHCGDQIGNLTPGLEADFTVVDLASTPAIAQRADRATTIWEALFPTIMMGDDRAIRETWVAGQKIALPE